MRPISTLASKHAIFEQICFDVDSTTAERRDARRIFYSGALATLELIVEFNKNRDPVKIVEKVQNIQNELNDFISGLKEKTN